MCLNGRQTNEQERYKRIPEKEELLCFPPRGGVQREFQNLFAFPRITRTFQHLFLLLFGFHLPLSVSKQRINAIPFHLATRWTDSSAREDNTVTPCLPLVSHSIGESIGLLCVVLVPLRTLSICLCPWTMDTLIILLFCGNTITIFNQCIILSTWMHPLSTWNGWQEGRKSQLALGGRQRIKNR